MDVFEEFRGRIAEHIFEILRDESLTLKSVSKFTVELPRDAAHGDLACNAAMVLANANGKPPREIAEKLAERLRDDEDIKEIDIAGPGFLNLWLEDSYWQELIAKIRRVGAFLLPALLGQGLPINIEYVSANPTGPLHIGHARGAVIGDALARLLERAGYAVTREYYVNDAGGQIDNLARSVLWHYYEAIGEQQGEMPDGLYRGDYLRDIGEALAKKYGKNLANTPEDVQFDRIREFALKAMMRLIRDDLKTLGVRHGVFTSEEDLLADGAVDAALAQLEEKGLIYQGVLAPPKGKSPPDWDSREQTLFKASQFGDDSDRALKKSDGSWTYFASDIANHKNKYERGFYHYINIWGADHAGYIKRMQAAFNAVTDGRRELEIQTCNLVKLKRGGKEVKMSKRAGDYITLREVVDEVGGDAVRFMMLTRKSDMPLDFDFELVKEQSRDNPIFYVQYAHARICSVLRQNSELASLELEDRSGTTEIVPMLTGLKDPAELALIKKLAEFSRVFKRAVRGLEPHLIVTYLRELAAAFHALWNLGNDRPELRFITDDEELSRARLALLYAVRQVLRTGFDIIGVTPQDEMR